MELINSSPVPSDFDVVAGLPDGSRALIFTAKATFNILDNGQVKLERNEPFPLLKQDEGTELGLLPTDATLRLDPAFEVIMLGQAHVPEGRSIKEMKVSLSVGEEFRELDIIGDRQWQGEGDSARLSDAGAFESMPLTWDKAFGGTQQVLIDREACLDVSWPYNSAGKGFDHLTQARELGVAFSCPENYPQFAPVRELPNLEAPHERVRRWADTPLPVCWATVPQSSGMLFERFKRSRELSGKDHVLLGAPEMNHRAHPDWVIETPPAGALVQLEGVSKMGPLNFGIPEMRVVAELQDGSRVQKIELHPRSIVLLPDQMKFYLTFRAVTNYTSRDGETRKARIKVLKGWQPPPHDRRSRS